MTQARLEAVYLELMHFSTLWVLTSGTRPELACGNGAEGRLLPL